MMVFTELSLLKNICEDLKVFLNRTVRQDL